jgi:guanylate kinase
MNTEKKFKSIIISSPSGAGKTTLCKLLIKKMKNISLSISYTTRNQRLNEINGKDYFFVNKKKFVEMKKKNYFIETAINFGNYYGSPYKNFSTKNKNVLFDIDWKGARKIRKKIKKEDIIDFFILPPSVKELKKRLVKRGRDNSEDINLRLSYAIKEIGHFNEYSYVLINQNVMKTVNDIMHIIKYRNILENNKKLTDKKIKSLINI